MDLFSSNGVLIYAAFMCQALGFLARDELILRALIIVGSVLYISYYMIAGPLPLWEAAATTSVLLLINMVLVVVILRERSVAGLGQEDRLLYQSFRTFTPGQFRKLLRLATRHNAITAPMPLTREGETADQLFFVAQGALDLQKQGEHSSIPGWVFIGEIGYLLDAPATATATAQPGSTVLAWSTKDLREISHRSTAMGNALLASLNVDLAGKVARSLPHKADA